MPPYFRVNWAEPVQVETTYRTSISASARGASEERVALASRPSRACGYEALLKGPSSTNRVREFLDARARAFGWVPLGADETYLQHAVASGDTLLPCEHAFRRFHLGGRAIIVSRDGKHSTEVQVSSLSIPGIGISAPLGVDFPKGSLVYPAMWCKPQMTSEEELITDDLSKVSVSGEELEGPRSIPTSASPGPEVPMLPMGHNWRESLTVSMSPYGRSSQSGNSEVFQIGSDHSPMQMEFSVLARRQAWWTYLQFFDSIRGRTFPFWLPDPVTRWRVSLVGDRTLYIHEGAAPAGIGSVIAYSPTLRKTQRIGIHWFNNAEVNLLGPFDQDLRDDPRTRYVPGILFRSEADTLSESWITSDLVELSFPMKEVRNG